MTTDEYARMARTQEALQREEREHARCRRQLEWLIDALAMWKWSDAPNILGTLSDGKSKYIRKDELRARLNEIIPEPDL